MRCFLLCFLYNLAIIIYKIINYPDCMIVPVFFIKYTAERWLE